MDFYESYRTIEKLEESRLNEVIGQGLWGKVQAGAGKAMQAVGNVGQAITGKENKLQSAGQKVQVAGFTNQANRQEEQQQLQQKKQQQQQLTNDTEGFIQGNEIANKDNLESSKGNSKEDAKVLTGFLKGSGKAVYDKITQIANQGGSGQTTPQQQQTGQQTGQQAPVKESYTNMFIHKTLREGSQPSKKLQALSKEFIKTPTIKSLEQILSAPEFSKMKGSWDSYKQKNGIGQEQQQQQQQQQPQQEQSADQTQQQGEQQPTATPPAQNNTGGGQQQLDTGDGDENQPKPGNEAGGQVDLNAVRDLSGHLARYVGGKGDKTSITPQDKQTLQSLIQSLG
jgi:hypothetical protein